VRGIREDWHHRQHIKVAYMYLKSHSFDGAMTRLRERIKAYNAAHKVPESLTSGYHETMTQAWLRLIYFTLCEYGPAETADAFYEQNPQLWQMKALRFFYTRDLFLSARAKAEYVEPDLTPLPISRR
jgi:hypothetical protein